MVSCAEEQMKLYDEMPTHVLAKNKARGDLRHAYLMKEPTRNLPSYSRPGGIFFILQNNNIMLSFMLQQLLYHGILKVKNHKKRGAQRSVRREGRNAITSRQ